VAVAATAGQKSSQIEGRPRGALNMTNGAKGQSKGPDTNALREANELLYAIVDSSPSAIIGLDANRRITTWNRAAERLYGYSSAEVIGNIFPDAPTDLPVFVALFDQIMNGRVVHGLETERLRKDGTKAHIRYSAAPLHTSSGAVSGVITLSEDISERREALVVLKEQEARLRTVLETVPDAIIVIDARGAIQSFSGAAERQFGYRADEVMGRNVNVLMPSPYRDEHDEYINRYHKTHERRIIGIGREVFGQRKNGSIFPMYLSVGEGKLEGESLFVGIIHDITEQQATERRLREMQDELLQVSRMSGMGQMASSLAHELNQPLTAVSSLMQAARRMLEVGDPAAVGRARDAVEKAGQQVMRAGEIIRRLREFVSRGDTEKVVVPVDVIVKEALALACISNKFGTTKVDVRLDETSAVVADKVQVQQVILNLVRNGLEAMEAVSKPKLTVSTRMNNDMVEVSIADAGIGISAEVKERLFQPFVTTKHQGMGVGLSICRTIIEAHGGRLSAEDNPHGGTIFRFTLPRALDEADNADE